jgi:Sec-independent protein translocase protein TatA
MVVAIIIVGLIALAIFGLSRLSDGKRPGGTSLRRTKSSHINANGTPKRGYATIEAARAAAIQQSNKGRQPVTAYKCSTCKNFHIGHA